jgi:hypothetical protein
MWLRLVVVSCYVRSWVHREEQDKAVTMDCGVEFRQPNAAQWVLRQRCLLWLEV